MATARLDITYPTFTSGTTISIRRDDFNVGENPLVSMWESSESRVILFVTATAHWENHIHHQRYTFEAVGTVDPSDEVVFLKFLRKLHELKLPHLQEKIKRDETLLATVPFFFMPATDPYTEYQVIISYALLLYSV